MFCGRCFRTRGSRLWRSNGIHPALPHSSRGSRKSCSCIFSARTGSHPSSLLPPGPGQHHHRGQVLSHSVPRRHEEDWTAGFSAFLLVLVFLLITSTIFFFLLPSSSFFAILFDQKPLDPTPTFSSVLSCKACMTVEDESNFRCEKPLSVQSSLLFLTLERRGRNACSPSTRRWRSLKLPGEATKHLGPCCMTPMWWMLLRTWKMSWRLATTLGPRPPRRGKLSP